MTGPPDIDGAALAARLLPAVRVFARRHCSSVQDVDDFCQDALVRILGLVEAERCEQPERIGAFAIGVCRRMYSERQRRENRRDALWRRWGPTVEPIVMHPVEFDAVTVRLEGCLSALTRRAQEVVRRTWYEEQSGPEIGAALSMSVGSVRVARHRALAALRRCLGEGGVIGHRSD